MCVPICDLIPCLTLSSTYYNYHTHIKRLTLTVVRESKTPIYCVRLPDFKSRLEIVEHQFATLHI